jgi:hypothetical protein
MARHFYSNVLNILAPPKKSTLPQLSNYRTPPISLHTPYLPEIRLLPVFYTRGWCLLGVDMLGCDVLSVVILIDSGVVGIRIFFAGMLAFAKF